MSRQRRPGALRGSEAWKARVAAGRRRELERKRALARVLPADLEAAWSGTSSVRAELRAVLPEAAEALAAWIDALGGESLSPQRRSLLESAARLLPVEGVLWLRFAQTGDPELSTKIASVVSSRARLLERAGLDRRDLDAFDPRRPLEVRWAGEAALDEADAAEADPEAAPGGDRPGERNLDGRPPDGADGEEGAP